MARDADFDFVRDPDEWETGDEPITEAQRGYLPPARKAGEPKTDEELDRLTNAEASERIDELQRGARSLQYRYGDSNPGFRTENEPGRLRLFALSG